MGVSGTYRDMSRRGIRTSTSSDPRMKLEDISAKIRTLSAYRTPIQTLAELGIIKKGTPPKNHKTEVMQDYEFNAYDNVTAFTAGTGNYAGMALISMSQASRPDMAGQMYYQPQDTFYIPATGQNVQVIMNPTSSIRMSMGSGTGAFLSDSTLKTAFGLATDSTTPAGTILVRTILKEPIRDPGTNATAVYKQRTIFESQAIEAESSMRDVVFDCNFVEHKDATLIFTEDQRYLIQGKYFDDLEHQRKKAIEDMKDGVEKTLLLGDRQILYGVDGRPMRFMGGLIPSIKTNVMVYNIYRDAFFNFKFGYSAAQSVILFLIILLITLIQFKFEKKMVSY